MPEKVQGLIEPLKAEIAASGMNHFALAKAAGISPIAIGRFMRDERSLSLGTADKLARVLQLVLDKPARKPPAKPQWRDTRRDPATWVLEIGGKIVGEVQQLDSGEWRWQRFTSIDQAGIPPAGGTATSRRDAQKKAWPILGRRHA